MAREANLDRPTHAAAAPGGDDSSSRVAEQTRLVLDAAAHVQWDRISSRPARSLPGLARLLEQPSSFGVQESIAPTTRQITFHPPCTLHYQANHTPAARR